MTRLTLMMVALAVPPLYAVLYVTGVVVPRGLSYADAVFYVLVLELATLVAGLALTAALAVVTARTASKSVLTWAFVASMVASLAGVASMACGHYEEYVAGMALPIIDLFIFLIPIGWLTAVCFFVGECVITVRSRTRRGTSSQ